MFPSFAWCFCCFWLLIFCLIFCASVSDVSWISFFIILVERSFDKIKEYSYSWFEISAKIGIISPLILKGMIIASSWYQNNVCISPVIAGLNSDVISSSSWFSWSKKLGMVLMIYDSLCLKAVMKQEYVA